MPEGMAPEPTLTDEEADDLLACCDGRYPAHKYSTRMKPLNRCYVGEQAFLQGCRRCDIVRVRVITTKKDAQGNIVPAMKTFIGYGDKLWEMPERRRREVAHGPPGVGS